MPPERSADLRDYYSKHAKSDRRDSQMLARLPLLHPEGLYPSEGIGPGDPMRRATKLRASLVKRRCAIRGRLDAYLELLGPGWHGEPTMKNPQHRKRFWSQALIRGHTIFEVWLPQ